VQVTIEVSNVKGFLVFWLFKFMKYKYRLAKTQAVLISTKITVLQM
jgi:hypothetical protein